MESNLNLRNELGQYNLLAELLADRNTIPLIFVKFQGLDKSSISERSDYGYRCIITAYENLKNRIHAENICRSDTTVRPRIDEYLFDSNCVNEAIINALVHNDWTISEPQISMFQDRLDILSHGGLPSGMTKEQFFQGISRPRNVTLMRIFLMMGLTEHIGHGIPAIVNTYGEEVFDIKENYIRCTIPLNTSVLGQSFLKKEIDSLDKLELNRTEKKVVLSIIEQPNATSKDLAHLIGVSQRTIERTLKSLQDKHVVERIGARRNGRWIVKR